MARPPGTRDTRHRIFQAAVRLFSERGYYGVSIRDIAREVGIKESSLYNHFPGKDALIGAIYETFRERMLGHEVTAEAVDARLEEHGAADYFHVTFMVWRILAVEQFRDERANRLYNKDIGRKLHDDTVLVLSRMRRRGVIRDVDLSVAALALVEGIKGMMFRFTGVGYETKDEFLASAGRHIDFMWDRLSVSGGTSRPSPV